MGFDAVEEEPGLTPIAGVMDLPLPKSLAHAASMVCSKHDIEASDQKGAQLHARQAGSPVKPMPAEMYAAIMLYTSNAIYAALNKVLREENRAGVKVCLI